MKNLKCIKSSNSTAAEENELKIMFEPSYNDNNYVRYTAHLMTFILYKQTSKLLLFRIVNFIFQNEPKRISKFPNL